MQEVKNLKDVWYLGGKGGEKHIKKLSKKARGNVAEEKRFGLKGDLVWRRPMKGKKRET